MREPTKKNEAAVSLGKLAGKKNKKRGKKFFSNIGKKGAAGRWNKNNGVDNERKSR